ncbi:MAG TPA: hypothetical protein VK421_09330 [Pyrinomonadaceae bacterium]|nr:hypothetical protein [Pyrinomonadaceae bacterium]
MASTKLNQLIDLLYERTQKGQVNWESTPDEDAFVVHFSELSLSIRSGYDEDGDEFVSISLRNQNGRVIDNDYFWDAMTETGAWDKAFSLYSAAKRKALGVDEALDRILDELKTNAVVGRARSRQK